MNGFSRRHLAALMALVLCLTVISVPNISAAAGNTPEEATVLQPGKTVERTMVSDRETHWYQITPTEEHIRTYTHIAFETVGESELKIEIYPDLESAKNDDTYNSYRYWLDMDETRTIHFPIAWHGPYYVKVTNMDENNRYHITASPTHLVPTEGSDEEEFIFGTPSTAAKKANHTIENEIIVKVKDNAKAEKAFKAAINKKVRTLGKKTPNIRALQSDDDKTILPNVYVVKLDGNGTKKQTETIAKQLNALPEIEYAEPNRTAYLLTNDVYYPYQWSLENRGDSGYAHADINFSKLEKALEGKNLNKTRIAVVDTGVNDTVADLKGVVRHDLGKNFENKNKTAMDDEGHGTHVTGIIAATGGNGFSMSGINPYAEILPVKVLNSWGGGSIDRIALGIKYAVDHGAKVINLSIGLGEESLVMEEVLKYAWEKNVTLVAAAGNDGIDSLDYPASSPYTISVGSTNNLDTLSFFSSYGEGLDLVAPGSDIPSFVLDGNIRLASGTSMAAPHVSAVAGLLYAVRPDITPEQVREYFHKYSHDLGESGYDEVYGWGRLDAFKVFSAVDLNLRVNEVKDNHKVVTGKIQPGATVTVKRAKKMIGEGKANTSGNFSVKIPQQKAGAKLIIEAKDSRGLEWTAATVTVIDGTPPQPPKVNPVYSTDQRVTGTAEKYATITVKRGSKTVGTARVNSKGKFIAKLNKPHKAGALLRVTATDKAGNVSQVTAVKVKQGKTK